VSGLVSFTLALFAVGAMLMAWGSRDATVVERKLRWIKFAVYVVIVHAILWAASVGKLPEVFAALAAFGGAELVLACGRAKRYALLAVALPVYAALGFGLLDFAAAARHAPQPLVLVYLVVAVFDAYSQLIGQWLGKRKLVPALSPGKTVEGLAGGGAAAVVAAVVLAYPLALDQLGPLRLGAIGLLVGGLALAGDLLASFVKRRCGIKDFGAIVPGHGGVLDRFDSLLFAAPVCWALLLLWQSRTLDGLAPRLP